MSGGETYGPSLAELQSQTKTATPEGGSQQNQAAEQSLTGAAPGLQDPAEEASAAAGAEGDPQQARDEFSAQGDETTSPLEDFDRKEVAKKIEEGSSQVLSREAEAADKEYSALSEADQKVWDAQNKGKAALRQMRALMDLQPGKLGVKGNGIDMTEGGGNPIRIISKTDSGQTDETIITRLVSATDTHFSCMVEGSSVAIPIPRNDVLKASLTAERDEIEKVIPETERELVTKHLDILAATTLATGEDPLEGMTAEQVDKLIKQIPKDSDIQKEGETSEDTKMRIRVKEKVIQDFGRVDYLPTHEEATLKHYRTKYEDFAKVEKARIEAREKEVGRKLKPEELLYEQMATVQQFQEQNARQYEKSDLYENTFQHAVANRAAELGRPLSPDEITALEKQLIFNFANNRDRQVVMDERAMKEMMKKMSKQDQATIVAMLILLMGKEFVAEFLPPMK